MEKEGTSPWFWKIFGGTIVGGITFLLISLLNNLSSNTDKVRADLATTQAQITTLVERIASLEQLQASAKENNSKVSDLKDRLIAIEKTQELEKDRKAAIDETIKSLQSDLKEMSKSVVNNK